MNAPIIWLFIAIIFAAIEVKSPLFGFIFVSTSAIIAGLLSLAHVSLLIQLGVFVGMLVLSIFLLRPWFLSRFKKSHHLFLSRAERLVGHKGIVTEDINPLRGIGRILVAGEDWAAQSNLFLPSGTEVIVDGSDGIILTVKEI